MSQEQAKALIEKMKSDKAFRKRVMDIEEVDARMVFINSKGFNCTVDEIKQIQERLMDEDLNAITKGCSPKCPGKCPEKENC